MAEKYFAKFPLISYANNAAVNIVERAKITDNVFNNPYVWYKYDIRNFERPDQIADFYYNDEFMDWLLYLSNQIVDPYYEWYMSDDVFFAYIVKKYNLVTTNNITLLQNKVHSYINNWYNGEKISISDYNALPTSQHRYWQPTYTQNDVINGYIRNKVDWQLKTNAIVSYAVNTDAKFIANEIVFINFDANNVGKAQVLQSNSSYVTVNHVSGHIYNTPSGSSYIYGTESAANVVFTSVVSIANNIISGEERYWDALMIYDMERAANESKKSIKVLDRTYSMQVSKTLTKLL
jgi:hypothetical protein